MAAALVDIRLSSSDFGNLDVCDHRFFFSFHRFALALLTQRHGLLVRQMENLISVSTRRELFELDSIAFNIRDSGRTGIRIKVIVEPTTNK